MRTKILTLLFAAVVLPTVAAAQVEIEADPLAYAFNGYSLHVAKMVGKTRVNVGVFGIDIPDWLHSNDGWSSTMRGGGIKWDYVGSSSDGWFAGVDGGVMRTDYTLDVARETERRNVFGVGLRGGYRVPLGGAGLYVVPWMSVGYALGRDVVIGSERFDHNPILIFPTVHVGWRF